MNTRLADVKLLLKAKLAKIFTKNPLILFMVQFDQSYALFISQRDDHLFLNNKHKYIFLYLIIIPP